MGEMLLKLPKDKIQQDVLMFQGMQADQVLNAIQQFSVMDHEDNKQ